MLTRNSSRLHAASATENTAMGQTSSQPVSSTSQGTTSSANNEDTVDTNRHTSTSSSRNIFAECDGSQDELTTDQLKNVSSTSGTSQSVDNKQQQQQQLEKKCSIDDDDEDVCPICLMDPIHPVRLPCSHIFCFLCLKGVTLTNGYQCPMCRSSIAPDFLAQPTLLTPPAALSRTSSGRRPRRARTSSTDTLSSAPSSSTGETSLQNQWFYEGKNGWWRYDARTNEELEEALAGGISSITLLLAGHNFTIDLQNMTQTRSDGGGLLRKIKRGSPKCHAKGTAGLHTSTLVSAGSRKQSQHKRKRKD